MRNIPNTNKIQLHLHCKQCFEDKPAEISMSDFQRIEVGWTELGLQMWCKRHNRNIVHIDFEGKQHPANIT